MASIYDKASLVLIPSGSKTSKVYSQKPVSGDGDFTFSRSTAATRVNADGVIEKETQNLVLHSSDQSNAYFNIRNNIDSVTAVSNPITGQNDAYKILSTATADPYFGANVTTGLMNGVNTFSCWLWTDSGQNTEATLILYNADISELASKSIILTTTPTRYELFANISNFKGTATLRLDLCQTCGITYLYTYGWQFEQGLVARDYIETTTTAVEGGITDNVPRLDYTDSSCPALLLEPQRTNNAPYSEYQSGGGFSLGTNITWNGFVESPEGVNNASRFTSNAASSSFVQIPNTIIPAGDFTFSMWVRGVSGSFVNRSMYIPSHTGTQATMNEAPVAGEDWKLVYGSGTNTSGSSYSRPITLPFYDQPVGAVWEMYGFQLEAGSYATSYIPTYGSAVTRNVGTAINNNNSNLPTGYPFSLFAEIDVVDTGSGYAITLLTSSNSANYYTIEYFSNTWHITARPNGATTRIPSSPPVTSGTHKVLGIFTDTTLKLYRNGAEIASGSHSQTFNGNIDDLLIGQLRTAGDTGTRNPVRQALVFNQALTDQEAIDLTTL